MDTSLTTSSARVKVSDVIAIFVGRREGDEHRSFSVRICDEMSNSVALSNLYTGPYEM